MIIQDLIEKLQTYNPKSPVMCLMNARPAGNIIGFAGKKVGNKEWIYIIDEFNRDCANRIVDKTFVDIVDDKE